MTRPESPALAFAIERRAAGEGVLLRFEGPLRLGCREAATGLQLVEYVKCLINEGTCRIALDLDGLVKTPDSSGLGELVAVESALRHNGGRLVLLNVTPKLEQIITTLGLTTLFEVAPSEEAAVARLDANSRA
jgi:anti-anti-sigma factor